jgi:hypothetical protein
MKKTPPPLPPLPPLSFQALGEVRDVEDSIQDVLQDCDDNLERVRQTLHTGVAEKLNVLWDYYFSLPDPQIEWFAQLIPRTVDSIIGLTPFARGEQFRSELLRMAAHHLPQRLEANKNKAATAAPAKPDGDDRGALKKAYLAKFPGVVILDICFAAGQHYSEWKRWLHDDDAVKDGSVPDRAFRAILTSGKLPREYRVQRRPKGWR